MQGGLLIVPLLTHFNSDGAYAAERIRPGTINRKCISRYSLPRPNPKSWTPRRKQPMQRKRTALQRVLEQTARHIYGYSMIPSCVLGLEPTIT